METQLERIATVAKEKPEEKFTSLIHLINKESLMESHKTMSTGKASGVDGMTKEQYSLFSPL